MADEPEDVGETAGNRPGQQSTARHEQTYALFLADLHQRSSLPAERLDKVLSLVMCGLKGQLVQEGSEDLRAPLPVKLQEALQACQSRHVLPPSDGGVELLLNQVSEALGDHRDWAESTTRSVLASVRAQLTEIEAEQVAEALSLPLRALWARPI